MAGKLSPSATLLRKSRLFALPSSLSPPKEPPTSRFTTNSESATQPYPIRAAIETPPSSLARGDWGLKRPLPAKSTSARSSHPIIRVNKLDTYEHITDFVSASDHVVSLQKFQELGLPISYKTHAAVSGYTRHQSVFEAFADNMAQTSGRNTRYRFRGPWLAGLTETEFQKYLKKVRKQKPEFLQKLQQVIVENMVAEKKRECMDEGVPLKESDLPKDISDAEFDSALLRLRGNPAALGPTIHQFLDLATPPKVPDSRVHVKHWSAGPSNLSAGVYAQNGPPKTHPSAGISYLRSNSHIPNHPVVGPQRDTAPIPARLLITQRRSPNEIPKKVVGVAGFVTDDIDHTASRDLSPKGDFLYPDQPGGSKIWVHPSRAEVNSDGKLLLKVKGATSTTKALYHGVKDNVSGLPERFQNPPKLLPHLDG
ncbi:hypothetical protein FQN57_007536 [Myotisia sp. PD_48]|nr:hypothetical protein FQN57_007536 [Myotisia sp. PD_48]